MQEATTFSLVTSSLIVQNKHMRIVSLLPAATEWVCALGAQELLVGRSHECDYPPSVQALPALTQATYPNLSDSAAIDAAVRKQVQNGLSLYHVDIDQLRALQPDLIITQDQCAVCAISQGDLTRALADWIGKQPQLISMHPHSVKQVMDVGLKIGRTIGHGREAMAFIGNAERQLLELQRQVGTTKKSDTGLSVVCIEWLEPIMTAGHWMPGLVALAGGQALLAEAGARSEYVTWDRIQAVNPEVFAIMPCGFDLGQTKQDLHYLTKRPGWEALRAVQNERVYLFDGNAYFNRPGPRLYRSIELMASALYPDRARTCMPAIASWEMMPLHELQVAR